jgi:hypothetical protein
MRRLLALALISAAALTAAPVAHAADYVGCILRHNELPDPEYGGHGYLYPKETVNDCFLPIVP